MTVCYLRVSSLADLILWLILDLLSALLCYKRARCILLLLNWLRAGLSLQLEGLVLLPHHFVQRALIISVYFLDLVYYLQHTLYDNNFYQLSNYNILFKLVNPLFNFYISSIYSLSARYTLLVATYDHSRIAFNYHYLTLYKLISLDNYLF